MKKKPKEKQPGLYASTKMFLTVARRCRLDKALWIFLASIGIGAAVVLILEPGITSYGDALWFLFVSCTTIGYGDFISVTLLGRCLVVYLTIYQLLLMALLTGVFVSHYREMVHRREMYHVEELLDRFQHLQGLSKEELGQIEEKARSLRQRL